MAVGQHVNNRSDPLLFEENIMPPQDTRPFYDVIHIGRSKCASTYLQKTALPAHPEIDLFFDEHKAAFHEYWNYDFGIEPEYFLSELNKTPYWGRKKTARVRVFSHESLTGHMATGRDARLIADLTLRAFGKIKAFIIVREPYAYIYSVWNQYIQEGGVLTFKQYLTDPSSPTWNRTLERSRVWRAATNVDLINYWQTLLGKQNLLVLCLEDLIRNRERFWAKLYGFIGVDSTFVPPPASERAGYSLPLLGIKRVLNRYVRTHHNPSGLLSSDVHDEVRGLGRKYAPLITSKRKLDPRVFATNMIKDEIRADNKRLSEILDRDLTELGYET